MGEMGEMGWSESTSHHLPIPPILPIWPILFALRT